MRFIRENLFYVVLVGATVVLGGVAVAYYLGSDLDRRIKRRTALSSKLGRLTRSGVQKVSQKAVTELQRLLKSLATAAKNDIDGAVAFNRQNLRVVKLKSPGSAIPIDAFPIDEKRYSDEGLYFVFIQQYNQLLDGLLAMPELRRTRLPTREELRLEETRLRETYKQQARAKAAESLRVKQATKGLVYVEAEALDRVFSRGMTKATPEQVWYAQVNLWVTQEILQAIASANAGWVAERVAAGLDANSASVLNSAVKRLVQVNVSEQFVTGMGVGESNVTLSERVSTEEYGLVRYRFSVVMPTRHIDRLLRALMTQNYHTVTNVQIGPVPREKQFYYGPEPSMLVAVDAEMLLLQRWIRQLLPPRVADALPAPPAVQAGKGT